MKTVDSRYKDTEIPLAWASTTNANARHFMNENCITGMRTKIDV